MSSGSLQFSSSHSSTFLVPPKLLKCYSTFLAPLKTTQMKTKLTLQKRIKAAATDTVLTRKESSVHKEKVGLV